MAAAVAGACCKQNSVQSRLHGCPSSLGLSCTEAGHDEETEGQEGEHRSSRFFSPLETMSHSQNSSHMQCDYRQKYYNMKVRKTSSVYESTVPVQ